MNATGGCIAGREAMIGTNRYTGSPVERIEDLRFLRGRGQFVGDLKRENILHAAILRSPVAHGLVAGVDASAALSMAGVRAVITAKDIGAVPRIPLCLLPLPGTERFLARQVPWRSPNRRAPYGLRL
jgi:carbon-monoxide dehydrogenase large subunit